MEEQKLLRRVVIVSVVVLFVITTVFFFFQVKPNIDQISFLRSNRYEGHPKAISANIAAEWRKIGGKAVQYLLINGVALGIGLFILLSLKPSQSRKKNETQEDSKVNPKSP